MKVTIIILLFRDFDIELFPCVFGLVHGSEIGCASQMLICLGLIPMEERANRRRPLF